MDNDSTMPGVQMECMFALMTGNMLVRFLMEVEMSTADLDSVSEYCGTRVKESNVIMTSQYS